jgi:Protein of unknown function (DUF1553)/Protein of unknown function (DUF1549)
MRSLIRCLPSLALLLTLAAPPAPAARRPASRPSRPTPTREASATTRALTVVPVTVALTGAEAEQGLQVTVVDTQGVEHDATGAARYVSSNPKVVRVGADGRLCIAGDGTAEVRVEAGGRSARVRVTARDAATPRRLNFTNEILPVLSKAGCNQGSCHGKATGQGGFKLSVLAFDPAFDYNAIVKEARGRRVQRSNPDRSLILLKPTAGLPHGGGQRFTTGSPEYRLLRRWIAEGMPFGDARDPVLSGIEVSPAGRVLLPRQEQPLLVTAVYSDGTRRDVTGEAAYSSNEDQIAAVDASGRIQTEDVAGEAAIMVRYMGQVTVSRVTVPLARVPAPQIYARLPRANFVDEHVIGKLQELRILPAGRCSDTEFVRRAFLDIIGTLPTVEEARDFLLDRDLGKRAKLVDALLERPEYADYWGMRWADVMLVNRDPLFPKGGYNYDRWVREQFRRNRPYNEFAYDVLTAQGYTYRDGAPNFFRSVPTPTDATIAVSQLFLGVRLECAQCHHHPFERWSQDDFYHLAAYFARLRRKGSTEYESIVYVGTSGEVKNPRTGEVMTARPLPVATEALGVGRQALGLTTDHRPPTTDPPGNPPARGPTPNAQGPQAADPRIELAEWVTSPENPFFARVAVNRIWEALMGRGLFEPVDDQRTTNPASNEPLLAALAQEFVAHHYDFKHLIRVIMASETYQRSGRINATNARDTRNYSRAYVKRMPAEVLMDAVNQLTGSYEPFQGLPPGLRATQLWDSKLNNYFLSVFGRPDRGSVCTCGRSSEGSVTQVLHLMNSPGIQTKLAAEDGRAAQLAASTGTEEQIIRELYMGAYSRPPTFRERRAALAAYARPGTTRRAATEDILWALINSPEFVFNH